MNMNENNEQPMTDAAAEHEAETSDSCDIGPETDCAADDSGEVDLNPPPSPKPKRRKRRLLLLCVGAVMLAVFGFAVWFVAHTTRPVTVEVGETYDFDAHYRNSFLPELYEMRSFPDDLSQTGDYSADLCFFGFLNWKKPILVRDSVPPTFSLRKVCLLAGGELAAEDFVLSYEDRSAVVFDLVHTPSLSEAGEYEVTVRASDLYGNFAEETVVLQIRDASHMISADLNSTSPEACLIDMFPDITRTEVGAETWNLPGEYTIRGESDDCVYLWKFRTEDSVLPKVKTKNLCIRLGETVTAEGFLRDAEDLSPCSASFSAEPLWNEVGIHRVGLRVADAFGNATSVWANVMIADLPTVHEVEYGLRLEELEETLFRNMMPQKSYYFLSEDLAEEDGRLPLGTNILRYETVFGDYEVELIVRDTTPPELAVEDITLYVGDSIAAEDFASGCEDCSEVVFTAAAASDTAKADLSDLSEGVYLLTVTAEDASGNATSKTAVLTVIPDTEAPVIHGAQNLFLYTGQEISPNESVYATDNRDKTPEVTADASQINTAEAGTYLLRYSCTDTAGNTVTETVTVEIIADTEPPVIYGAINRSILVGESVSFRKGVYAMDAQCGTLNVKVDSSAVNTHAEGVYPVTYSSTDPSGNTASVTVYLTVSALTVDKVNRMVDEILSWIVTPGMTVYEKAWAIYAWCTGNLQYSTRTSYLMGQFDEAAYSGLITRSGNCYVYYAVASALLTRAGIENIEIQRDDPNNPHYWNLVKVNGSWYHFDTCPHYAGHWLQSFLLTDAQVRAYSHNEVWGYYSFDPSLYPATP